LQMKRSGLFLSFLLLGFLLLAFIVVPIGNIFYVQLVEDLGGLVKALREPAVLNSIWLSIYATSISTLIAFILGTPLAYILARKEFWGKKLISSIVDLPVVIPHIVAGIILYAIFSRNGLFGGPLKGVITFEDAVPGIIAAMLFVSVPYFVNSAREGFAAVDPRLENVARTLGASPWLAFHAISLPLASSYILSGAILSWARGISEYAAVSIIAYFPRSAPILIADRFSSYGLSASRSVAVLLLVICLLIFVSLRMMVRREG